MAKSFLHLVAAALGAATDEASADQLLQIMKQSGAPVSEWGLNLVATEAAHHPRSCAFRALDRHGLLSDSVADTFGKLAAVQGNHTMLDQWSKHPQANHMASSARGKAIVMSLLSGLGMTEEQRRLGFKSLFRQDLKWSQSTLDAAFRGAFTVSGISREYKEQIMETLLKKGANPAACVEGEDKAKSAAILFAHKAHEFNSAALAEFVSAFHWSKHWEEMLSLSDNGKSFAALLARTAPVGELAAGLDKGRKRWWDGDPYGLVDIVVQRAHREPSLLVSMCHRAQEKSVEVGLSPNSMGKLFSALFVSSGKSNSVASARAVFWQGPAQLMASLWKDPGPWKQMCSRAHAFELDQTQSSDEAARRVFAGSIVLELSTPQASASARRRSL